MGSAGYQGILTELIAAVAASVDTLAEAIDRRLHLLKIHLPYHESDHVLNFAFRHLQAATIERICRELNYTWRQRLLGPVVTVQAFLLQVLHGKPHRFLRGPAEVFVSTHARRGTQTPLLIFHTLFAFVTSTSSAQHADSNEVDS